MTSNPSERTEWKIFTIEAEIHILPIRNTTQVQWFIIPPHLTLELALNQQMVYGAGMSANHYQGCDDAMSEYVRLFPNVRV